MKQLGRDFLILHLISFVHCDIFFVWNDWKRICRCDACARGFAVDSVAKWRMRNVRDYYPPKDYHRVATTSALHVSLVKLMCTLSFISLSMCVYTVWYNAGRQTSVRYFLPEGSYRGSRQGSKRRNPVSSLTDRGCSSRQINSRIFCVISFHFLLSLLYGSRTLKASLTVGWLRDGDESDVSFGLFIFSYSAYWVLWRVLMCLIMFVVLKWLCWLPPRGISEPQTLQIANLMSLSNTLKKFQTGEVILPFAAIWQ